MSALSAASIWPFFKFIVLRILSVKPILKRVSYNLPGVWKSRLSSEVVFPAPRACPPAAPAPAPLPTLMLSCGIYHSLIYRYMSLLNIRYTPGTSPHCPRNEAKFLSQQPEFCHYSGLSAGPISQVPANCQTWRPARLCGDQRTPGPNPITPTAVRNAPVMSIYINIYIYIYICLYIYIDPHIA